MAVTGIILRSDGTGDADTTFEPIHAFLNNICCDLPASHKANGLRGHTSETFMCDMCEALFSSLVTPECFDTARTYTSTLYAQLLMRCRLQIA